jgi:hypothetical protein
MASADRVTVTLPAELVAGIDRYERNRSRFIAAAVAREIERRRREELLRSLKSPHPETGEVARLGLADWESRFAGDDDALVDVDDGKAIRWVEGKGWVEEPA